MPDAIPKDDLYARLGLRRDADAAAIERAWRSLLKRHHPDVAGAAALELAKQINVAHDWLGNVGRRARYDAATGGLAGPRRSRDVGRVDPRSHRPRPRPRPSSPPDDLDATFGPGAAAIRSFLAQVAGLSRDDLDRLSVSDPVDPSEELRDLVPAEWWARVANLEGRVARLAPAGLRADRRAAAAAAAFGRALVLDPLLWHQLADPEPLLDQMQRAWESSVGLPRYGPNTTEVAAVIDRLARLRPDEARDLVAAWDHLGDPQPWPPDAWEFDFAALEVSAALARRDAGETAASVVAATVAAARHEEGPIGPAARHTAAPVEAAARRAPTRGEARRWTAAFESTAHVVTLRPIFAPRAYGRYRRALAAILGSALGRPPGEAAQPTVRRRA
jgi:hypothetical protein